MLGQVEGTTAESSTLAVDDERVCVGAGRAGRDKNEEIDWFEEATALRPPRRPRLRREPPEGVWRGGREEAGVEEVGGRGGGADFVRVA